MKNTNKKSKKIVEEQKEFILVSVPKRKLLKVIRSTASFCLNRSSVLNNIKLKIKDETLTMWATDGNRAIETSLNVMVKTKTTLKEIEICVKAYLLTGLCLNVGNGDYITLRIGKESITFEDYWNDISHKIQTCEIDNYPNIEKIINEHNYKENAYEVAFNRNYMEQMKRLLVNEKTNVVKAIFNKEDNLSPIVFEVQNSSENITQRSLLMPIQLRD